MDLEQTLTYIDNAGDNDLFILWTNADPVTAELMVFMYARNCMKYNMWDNLMIVIWGSTTKLAAENEEIQKSIKELQALGVKMSACVTCAEELGVKDKIESLGIDLVKWLKPLTKIKKEKKNLLSI